MEWAQQISYHGHMRIVSSFKTAVLVLALPLLLAACGGGAAGGTETNSPPTSSSSSSAASSLSPDTTPPVITITGPTTGTSYTATGPSVIVAGTATDNVGLSQISWSNSLGESGSISVSGTSANGSFNIALKSGANAIRVTALDTSGNTAQKLLTITYTPSTSNSATLAWDPPVGVTNLSGYRLYYGTSPGTYLQSYGQGINVGNVTTYTLMGLSSKTRYYFTVTAIDTSGNESGYSNEAFKDVP